MSWEIIKENLIKIIEKQVPTTQKEELEKKQSLDRLREKS
jgi:hypothetical protein